MVEQVSEEDKFKYIDDLSVLEAVNHRQKLVEYNVLCHIPSDVPINERYLPPEALETPEINDQISQWTERNIMRLNEDKSNYMVLACSNEKFATRISLNKQTLDRVKEICHLGLWITEDLKWNKHITKMCKKAYSRIKMLTKLKYIGTNIEDLVHIYCIHIRSYAEYCSTVFHSSLTEKLTRKIEAIQKTSLRIILGDMYITYDAALEMCGVKSLHERRENRSLKFAIKCEKSKDNSNMFPRNLSVDTHPIRNREKFIVNFARTEAYKKSAIPVLQRRLNTHYM